MIVEKQRLFELFEKGEKTGNWDGFFFEVDRIVKYTINSKFPNIKEKEDLAQECLGKVWQLIQRGQLNKNGNLFSYIIGATNYRSRDEIRKLNRRKAKAKIVHVSNEALLDIIENLQMH